MPKKSKVSKGTLKPLVGARTYGVWVEMLSQLVPHGRTHRLGPFVAGMLHYSSAVAYEKFGDSPPEGSAAEALLVAAETGDIEEAAEHLETVVNALFEDAGVDATRTSSRGDEYSIAENAIMEFVKWYDMPWE